MATCYLNDVPGIIPFAPPVSISASYKGCENVIMGQLIYAIQITMNGNMARGYVYTLASENGYNNNTFIKWLQTACDIFECMVQNAQQGDTLDSLCILAAETMAAFATVDVVASYQDIFNNLTPAEQNSLRELERGYGQWLDVVRAKLYQQPQQNYVQQQQPMFSSNPSRQTIGATRPSISSGSSRNTLGSNSGGSMGSAMIDKTAATQEPVSTRLPPAKPVKSAQQNNPAPVIKPVDKCILNTDNLHLLKDSAPIVYDSKTQVSIIQQTVDGKYLASVLNKGDAVNYVIHENQHLIRNRNYALIPNDANENAKADAVKEQVASLLEKFSGSTGVGELKPGESFPLITIPVTTTSETKYAYEEILRVLAYEEVTWSHANSALAFNNICGLFFDVEQFSQDPDIIALKLASTLEHLRDALVELITPFGDYQWGLLVGRVTSCINRILKTYGIDAVSIDNFVDDLDDLIKYIDEEHGTVASSFKSFAVSELMGSILRCDFRAVLKDEKLSGYSDYFLTIEKVIVLPLLSNQIDLSACGGFGNLDQRTLPATYELVHRVFGNAPQEYFRLVLVTLDGGYIYVYRAPDRNSYVMSNQDTY